ncbi:hypothetical protein SAMN06295974_1352 [Plantibacter flavus]|uniref:Uncharacterized protein n=1 Tax=Plantibacter flavus TaxID=150123 RepID=A0A3N2C6Y7_9MICO|nr:hypothetical protein EDD42_3396 [Plantibacter flavus]SMG22306.1 hypothetical protein SAMN06295974_1352 [Plantibacter flavus]
MAVDREQSRPWVEVAQSARILRDLLDETPPAIDGSPFSVIDEELPQSCEKWCRSYLSSALEHLGMWADYVAPMNLHPDSAVRHDARPVQTLARAALESASQAVWIMASRDPSEVLRRHLSLVLADWAEQRKAEVDLERKADLKKQRLDLLDVLESHGVKVDEPSYLTLVTTAAHEVRTNLSDGDLGDPAQVERLWRTAAGSAHGKMWPSLALRVSVEIDGQSFSFPDADAMSSILVLANRVTQYGVLRFIDYAGHEPQLAELLRAASLRLYARIPKVEGAPERLEDVPGYPATETKSATSQKDR